MEAANAVVSHLAVAKTVVDRGRYERRALRHAEIHIRIASEVVVIIVAAGRLIGIFRSGMIVRSPMHRAGLIREIYIFHYGSRHNGVFIAAFIFKPPNAVETVQLSNARPVLKRPLEISLQFRLVFQPVASNEIPRSERIAIVIRRVARVGAALRWQECFPNVFESHIVWIYILKFAFFVFISSAAKFRHHLHSHRHRKRLRRLRAEIAPFIIEILVKVVFAIIKIEVVFEPAILHVFPIGYFPLYLHPSVGKRDVLEIHKTGTDLRHRTGIVRLDIVARAQFVVEQRRSALFHAYGKKHAPIFHFPVKLLQPNGRGMLPLRGRCLRSLIILLKRRSMAGDAFHAESIAETTRQIKFLFRFQLQRKSLWLRQNAAIPRHHVRRGKISASGISRNRTFIDKRSLCAGGYRRQRHKQNTFSHQFCFLLRAYSRIR